MLPVENVIAVILEQFTEAYEGPTQGRTWFSDNQPDAGFFRTLATLTAAEASEPLVPGGTTIAAHVEHLRWSLALANAVVRGGPLQPKWQESWSVRAVDPPAWERLQADLRQEFETLRAAIAAFAEGFRPEWLAGIMALVPHAAYHLGAIRQMIRTIRARGAQATP